MFKLGITAVNSEGFEEKYEPCKIQYFQGIKIKQIFAKGDNSFAISEDSNNIYGWGYNKKKFLKDSNQEYIGLPMLLSIDLVLRNEIYLVIDSSGLFADILECNIYF